MSDHLSNFPLQPFVQSFFADPTKTFPGRYLCLADSGQPFCIVVKHPQFEVSILLGVSRHLPPPSSPDADRILVGLMGPPFQFNPVHINKNLIQFPQCRYASETIDSWCLQCYLIRHAPLKVKFKKFSGQY